MKEPEEKPKQQIRVPDQALPGHWLPEDDMRALTRKGEVTILEHVGGKTIVAVRAASGSILTLEGGGEGEAHRRVVPDLQELARHVEAKGLRP
jgi:hypothetical protein